MRREKLKVFAEGIVGSKLKYCLAIYGSIFNVEKYKDKDKWCEENIGRKSHDESHKVLEAGLPEKKKK